MDLLATTGATNTGSISKYTQEDYTAYLALGIREGIAAGLGISLVSIAVVNLGVAAWGFL